jgi:hypothetical protein
MRRIREQAHQTSATTRTATGRGPWAKRAETNPAAAWSVATTSSSPVSWDLFLEVQADAIYSIEQVSRDNPGCLE